MWYLVVIRSVVPCKLKTRLSFLDCSALCLGRFPMWGLWCSEQSLWKRELVKEAFLSTQLTAVRELFCHLFPRLSLAMDSSMCLPLKACSERKKMCPSSLVKQKNDFYCTSNSYFFSFSFNIDSESWMGLVFQNTK